MTPFHENEWRVREAAPPDGVRGWPRFERSSNSGRERSS